MRHLLLLIALLSGAAGWSSDEVLGLGANPTATSVSGGTVNATSVTDSGLTSGRIPYASTGGLLADAAGLTFNGTTLVVPNCTNSSLTATRVPYAGTAGLMQDDSGFTRTSLALTLDANTDNLLTSGYGKLGFATSGTSTSFYVAQASNFNSTDFALRQGSNGSTTLNSKTGVNLILSRNGTAQLTINGTAATFASGTPIVASDTTNATTVATGGVSTSGGISAAKNIIGGMGVAQGVTSTATAAGTTTLTNTSVGVQIFTGATTQTVQLPAANLFGAGVSVQYVLINRSSGNVSWARAGSDTINGATSNVAVSSNTVGMIWSDGVSAWYTK